VIENQQIKDLPLNGRSVASLLALVPGAIDSGGGNLGAIRFAGRGVDDTNIRLDGIDATGIRAQNTNVSCGWSPYRVRRRAESRHPALWRGQRRHSRCAGRSRLQVRQQHLSWKLLLLLPEQCRRCHRHPLNPQLNTSTLIAEAKRASSVVGLPALLRFEGPAHPIYQEPGQARRRPTHGT
jgi:hypothetical protein